MQANGVKAPWNCKENLRPKQAHPIRSQPNLYLIFQEAKRHYC